jgi:hypothetical protein
MRINQRGYVSGTPLTATNNFCTDRFNVTCATTGGFSAYQSTTAPTGFTNSLFFTKTTGASPAVAEANFIYQAVEGYNMSDLAWGTANAKTVTLSFWVYAGATGTFSGSLRNGAATFYSYPFTYTIAAANTWTQITTTIAGPTVGTWTSDNTAGIYLFFDLGCGTNFRGTAGAWSAGNYIGATGATTYPVSTTGGTFYVTGVQLEVGTVATPFERRQYGEELMLCQRYYYRISASGNYTSFGLGITYATTTALLNMPLPVTMRTAPTAADFSAAGNFVIYDGGTNSTVTAIVLSYVSTNSISMTGTTGATMTAARPALLEANVALAAYIGVTAEL